jgi:uncharacterized protein YceH (UPF0502 family)
MLRGPQTAELRMNCERLHCFADIPAVEALLNEFAERSDAALVTQLPRQPGSRENRWMHLLSGAPAVQASSAAGLAAEASSISILRNNDGGIHRRSFRDGSRRSEIAPRTYQFADARSKPFWSS